MSTMCWFLETFLRSRRRTVVPKFLCELHNTVVSQKASKDSGISVNIS